MDQDGIKRLEKIENKIQTILRWIKTVQDSKFRQRQILVLNPEVVAPNDKNHNYLLFVIGSTHSNRHPIKSQQTVTEALIDSLVYEFSNSLILAYLPSVDILISNSMDIELESKEIIEKIKEKSSIKKDINILFVNDEDLELF